MGTLEFEKSGGRTADPSHGEGVVNFCGAARAGAFVSVHQRGDDVADRRVYWLPSQCTFMRKLPCGPAVRSGRCGKITERQVLECDMNSNLKTLSEKIQTLSAEQITEVEDFVEFLRHRRHDRELARAAATVSSPALEAIWNNPEDDVYDAV